MLQRIIAALLIALSSATAYAQTQTIEPRAVPALAENAPDRHVVVPGDTLWGIAAKFLKDPSRWSEVWKLNASEIKNPQRIYPGQIIVLNKTGSGPLLSLEPVEEKQLPRIREEALAQAIPAIPQKAIEPFLTRPLLMDEQSLESTPRIVAIEDERVLADIGTKLFARNLPADTQERNYLVYRAGEDVTDPETKEVLGHEAIVVGSARLEQTGPLSTLRVTSIQSEIHKDDRLVPQPRPRIISYPQHIPEQSINGRVIANSRDTVAAGRHEVISFSRGKRDGVEIGQVLTLFRPGQTVTDRYKGDVQSVTTPEERFGLVYVFRVFDRVSYGLIMQAERAVERDDIVRNP